LYFCIPKLSIALIGERGGTGGMFAMPRLFCDVLLEVQECIPLGEAVGSSAHEKLSHRYRRGEQRSLADDPPDACVPQRSIAIACRIVYTTAFENRNTAATSKVRPANCKRNGRVPEPFPRHPIAEATKTTIDMKMGHRTHGCSRSASSPRRLMSS
jgi:hypothetical protein